MLIYFVGPYPYYDFTRAKAAAVYFRSSFITRTENSELTGIFDMDLGKWLETEEELIQACEKMQANLDY